MNSCGAEAFGDIFIILAEDPESNKMIAQRIYNEVFCKYIDCCWQDLECDSSLIALGLLKVQHDNL